MRVLDSAVERGEEGRKGKEEWEGRKGRRMGKRRGIRREGERSGVGISFQQVRNRYISTGRKVY